MRARASNLAMRLATAAVGVPVILVFVYLAPPWAFFLLVLAVSLVGVYELLGMSHPGDRVAPLAGVLVSAAASAVVYFAADDARALLAVLVLVPLFGLLFTLARLGAMETAALRAFSLGIGPVLVGIPLTLLAVLRKRSAEGSGWVLLALGLAWLADTGAYFVGRWLGRRKLYPAVSPNKTLEGALGGLAASVVWAVIGTAGFVRGALPVAHAVALGLVAGALGQVGDLGESMLKRSTGVKDSGHIVPGHGGILDRVDALLMTSVAVFFYAEWLGAR